MKEAIREVDKKIDINKEINRLVDKASKALDKFMDLDQSQVDNIVKEMSMAGLDEHMRLAKMAVEETGRGIFEDKAIKNMFATE
ncbi:MAG TPA: hypothetical protein PK033_15365, partial [Acetivibrio sp.]|nr:hypothetical protein [Acetivibrio sp.]